jgi:2-keto-3-deoxy-galactonokinase
MIVGALIGAALVHWRRAAGLLPAVVVVGAAALVGALRARVASHDGSGNDRCT